MTLRSAAFGAARLQTGVLISAVVKAIFFQVMMMIGVDAFVSAIKHGATF
jgi:Ca2+/Na+ antiporter